MPLRADFEIVRFNSHLGDKAGDLNVNWATFHGNQTPVKNFYIGQKPSADAYVLIQAYDVESSNHEIVINGVSLGGFDIPTTDEYRWQTWMDVIESGILKQGNNTIQIKRAGGGDNFVIAHVAIPWREVV